MGTVEVVVFAGGVGSRMAGSTRPKQFLELSGRPIIDYTISQFARHSQISRIVVSCLESWIPYLKRWLVERNYSTPVDVVPGGINGQESIYHGVKHLHDLHPDDKDAVVLVHDGVRPLIDEETISACIKSVIEKGSTVTVAPSTETVIVENGTEVEQVLPRSRCFLARAPQGFKTEDLYACHIKAREEGLLDFIDSSELMSHYGYRIFIVEGPAENIKVTTPLDYFAFRGYMDERDQRLMWDNSAK